MASSSAGQTGLDANAPDPRPQDRLRLAQAIKDWSIAHVIAGQAPPGVARADTEGTLAIHAPVTLFPSRFPRSCFEEALSVQKAYNELYVAISRDEAFLAGLVKE